LGESGAEDAVALRAQRRGKEPYLGVFAAAVNAFDGDEFSGSSGHEMCLGVVYPTKGKGRKKSTTC